MIDVIHKSYPLTNTVGCSFPIANGREGKMTRLLTKEVNGLKKKIVLQAAELDRKKQSDRVGPWKKPVQRTRYIVTMGETDTSAEGQASDRRSNTCTHTLRINIRK